MSSPLRRKTAHGAVFTIFTTCWILAHFDIALVSQAMLSRQSFANHVSPFLRDSFFSELTAKIARLSTHCERGKDNTIIFVKLSHVSKIKCWERPHQPITALHFISLAYWPRPHATTYFNWSRLLTWTLPRRGTRTGTTSSNPRAWG